MTDFTMEKVQMLTSNKSYSSKGDVLEFGVCRVSHCRESSVHKKQAEQQINELDRTGNKRPFICGKPTAQQSDRRKTHV